MNSQKGLILLDRDGVLNKVVVHPEQGTIDSPLNPDEVEILPGVPEALALLNQLHFGLAIVTNQPSAAKGKTTLANLQKVHEKILEKIQSAGAVILSSHICFHQSQDHCSCRKPKTGLLEEAFQKNPGYDPLKSWMVGDGVTDIQAGQSLSLKTAFFGPDKHDARRIFSDLNVQPVFWGKNLPEFAAYLKKGEST